MLGVVVNSIVADYYSTCFEHSTTPSL